MAHILASCVDVSSFNSGSPTFFSLDRRDFPILLERQPQWRSSREFETTTRTTTVGLESSDASKDSIYDEFGEQESADDDLTPGKQKMSVVFVPTYDSTIGIYYKKRERLPPSLVPLSSSLAE